MSQRLCKLWIQLFYAKHVVHHFTPYRETMVHLIARIRGQNERIYHGMIVTVLDRTQTVGNWPVHPRIKGRVYSLGTGSETVLLKFQNRETWYPVADILDVHMSRPIVGVGVNGRQFRVFIGSFVRVNVLHGAGGWGQPGWNITICVVEEIDFEGSRVQVVVNPGNGWALPILAWYPIDEVLSVVWEM